MPLMSKPQGIGEMKTSGEWKHVHFEMPLPGTRKEVVESFSDILNLGGVQKVVVELGKPIAVDRIVDAKTDVFLPPAPEDVPDDFWGLVRNGRIEQMQHFVNKDGYVHLFEAFALITARKLRPRILFVHDHAQLRQWLELSETFPVDYVFGVETAKQPDIPDDAVILAAVGTDEAPALGIRIPVDMPGASVTPLKKSQS